MEIDWESPRRFDCALDRKPHKSAVVSPTNIEAKRHTGKQIEHLTEIQKLTVKVDECELAHPDYIGLNLT